MAPERTILLHLIDPPDAGQNDMLTAGCQESAREIVERHPITDP
jgi:hypothetical protein